MSYWCPKPEGATSDIFCKRSALTQVIAVKRVNWDMIRKRLEEYPHEAAEKDKFGVTILHHAIRKYSCDNTNVPEEIFDLLIEACPASLECCDSMTGFNVLHLACGSHYCDKMKDIIHIILDKRRECAKQLCCDGKLPLHRCKDATITERLINIYPEALGVVSKNHGYLPLHDACSDQKVPLDVVKTLIENGIKNNVGSKIGNGLSCGGLLVKDSHGDIPVKIMLRRVLFMKSSNNILDLDEDSMLWKKICFVAKATYITKRGMSLNNVNISSIPLLHAIIECGGHTSLVKYVLKLHPDQVLLRDDNGKVPLSVASSKVDCNHEILDLLLTHNENYKGSIAATMADNENRLPLHLAVESGRTWKNGVKLIADAAPLSIETRDGLTGMYPFMLASIPTFRWDNTCIDTIYTLIRKVPNIILEEDCNVGDDDKRTKLF